jgi:hypothetical protein
MFYDDEEEEEEEEDEDATTSCGGSDGRCSLDGSSEDESVQLCCDCAHTEEQCEECLILRTLDVDGDINPDLDEEEDVWVDCSEDETSDHDVD